jgi:hypothetical protein
VEVPPVREPTPPPRPTPRPVTPSGLVCTVRNQPQVSIRAIAELSIDVRNTGNLPLHDVKVWVNLPGTLAHRNGSRLEYRVGELPGGQTHRAILRLVGAQPGSAATRVLAFAREDVQSETVARLEVIAQRVLERESRSLPAGCTCVSAVTWR